MSDNKLTRRNFLQVAASGAVSLSLLKDNFSKNRVAKEQTLYVGTYTSRPSGTSEGIYIYRLNTVTGELTHLKTVKDVVDPSYLTIDRKRRFLYAVNEVSQFNGKPSGAVTAFAIDRTSHELTRLNQKASEGGSPCYITLDRTERFVLVANYEAGNISVLPIKRDGTLDDGVIVVQHEGSSVNRDRQQGPHAHCVIVDKLNRYVFGVDLGIDKILGYKFHARTGKLTKHSEIAVKPGAGPRHFAFHPNNRHAYVINELDSTVTAFNYDATRGILKDHQTISTLPAGFSGENSGADLHVSPNGKSLYASNRGHNSIVVFAIEGRTGRLTYLENVSTGGKTPRNFTLDPTGRLLLAANQNSDSVVTFHVDARSGRLTPTGHVAEIPTPVCLKLVP